MKPCSITVKLLLILLNWLKRMLLQETGRKSSRAAKTAFTFFVAFKGHFVPFVSSLEDLIYVKSMKKKRIFIWLTLKRWNDNILLCPSTMLGGHRETVSHIAIAKPLEEDIIRSASPSNIDGGRDVEQTWIPGSLFSDNCYERGGNLPLLFQ